MPTPTEVIAAEALKLSPRERAELADRLWTSVCAQAEVDAAWEAEIAYRIRQIDAGEVDGVPWDEAMAQLRTKYG